MSATIVEHGAPTGGGRRHAEAEETHGGFREDGASHADGRLHDHGLNNVGKNVTNDHAQIARAQRSRCFHELTLARGQYLGTDQARVSYPSSQAECEHEVENAGSAEGYESNCQQDSRKREKSIHDHDVDEAVEASAIVAGERSDDQAYGE
jgi:hypothetical protein